MTNIVLLYSIVVGIIFGAWLVFTINAYDKNYRGKD